MCVCVSVYVYVYIPDTGKSSGALSRSIFTATAAAERCHASHRGHMCPISLANSSFSRAMRRKRREKHTAGHYLQHYLITLAYPVLPAILNTKLGAPREQQRSCEGAVVPKNAN